MTPDCRETSIRRPLAFYWTSIGIPRIFLLLSSMEHGRDKSVTAKGPPNPKSAYKSYKTLCIIKSLDSPCMNDIRDYYKDKLDEVLVTVNSQVSALKKCMYQDVRTCECENDNHFSDVYWVRKLHNELEVLYNKKGLIRNLKLQKGRLADGTKPSTGYD